MTDYSYLASDDIAILNGNTDNQYPHDELVLDIEEDAVSLFVRTVYTTNDGIPFDVWHGRTQRITLASGPCAVHLPSLRKDLSEGGILSKWIDRIKNGLTVEWDGSNMVGSLDEDAQNASDEMNSAAYRGKLNYIDENISVWDEAEWFYNAAQSEIKGDWTDDQVKAWLEEGRECAESEPVILQGDALEYFLDMRDRKREDATE